jgi:hypothetical protein
MTGNELKRLFVEVLSWRLGLREDIESDEVYESVAAEGVQVNVCQVRFASCSSKG